MSHTINLSEEEYAALEAYAQRQGQSPDELIRAWVASVAEQPHEDWANVPPPTEEELRDSPFLRVMGSLSVGIPGWADRHDEVFGQEEADDDADKA